MNYKRNWEEITDHNGTTSRLEVPGGWIVQQCNGNCGTALCFVPKYFVPDHSHDWILDDKEEES